MTKSVEQKQGFRYIQRARQGNFRATPPCGGFPIRRPISKPVIVGILFAIGLFGLILYQTLGMRQVECEVCMEFDGRTKCLTVRGQDETQATQTAKDNACSYVTVGRAEAFRCAAIPPATTRCRQM